MTMSNDSSSMKPGWQGRRDQMREVAERTLIGDGKPSMTKRDGTGKFHKLTKQQSDMHIPRKVSNVKPQPLYNHGS